MNQNGEIKIAALVSSLKNNKMKTNAKNANTTYAVACPPINLNLLSLCSCGFF